MKYQLSPAQKNDVAIIWEILSHAISKRKAEGSTQWQDGYPNPPIILQDIEKNYGFVLHHGDHIIGYCALLIDDEPNYEHIEGQWKGVGSFMAVHRVAIAPQYLGKGLSTQMMLAIEAYALSKNIKIIRVDTSNDNEAMLHLFKKLNYFYRGTVKINNNHRLAYEKLLNE